MTGGALPPRTRKYLQRADLPTLEKPFEPVAFKKPVDAMIASNRADA